MRIKRSVTQLVTGIALVVASPVAAIAIGLAGFIPAVVIGVGLIIIGPRGFGRGDDDIILMLENKAERKQRRDKAERIRIAKAIYDAESKLIAIAAKYSEAHTVISQSARAQLSRAIARSGQILEVIENDHKGHAAQAFTDEYLQPLESFIELYTRLLTRDVSIAKEAMEHSETMTLPSIVSKLDELYTQLHVGDIAKLATLDTEVSVPSKTAALALAPAEATLER
jgi:hypothetical protein